MRGFPNRIRSAMLRKLFFPIPRCRPEGLDFDKPSLSPPLASHHFSISSRKAGCLVSVFRTKSSLLSMGGLRLSVTRVWRIASAPSQILIPFLEGREGAISFQFEGTLSLTPQRFSWLHGSALLVLRSIFFAIISALHLEAASPFSPSAF